MSKILAIDLGKFKSVTCCLDTDDNESGVLDDVHGPAVPPHGPQEVHARPGGHRILWARGLGTRRRARTKATKSWSATPIKRPGSGRTSNARPTAMMHSSWPNWLPWGQLVPVYIPVEATTRVSSAGEVPPGAPGTPQPGAEQHPGDLCPTWDADGAWPAGVGVGAVRAAGQHRKPLAECALDELWRGELDLELLALERLRAQYLQVQKKLKALALADERVRLLQTIPGVGRKTAEVVVAYLDEAAPFSQCTASVCPTQA